MRGVVYDVGLLYGGTTLSVETFDPARVDYDMSIIKNVLRCNTVRIEGQSIERLVKAAEIADTYGLNVLFNPWLMAADADNVVAYMGEAADAAQRLADRGIEVTFVTGCEYTLFNSGAIPGKDFDDRMQWLSSLGKGPGTAIEKLMQASEKLNKILQRICKRVRDRFSGKVTYSSGTWEMVDWAPFDIIGVDYYRNAESDEEYVAGLDRYRGDKPVYVMEVGCCAYKGAAVRGSEGFAIFQGVDASGNALYEGGITPQRSETEQADYVERQISLLDQAGVECVCIYVFSYPVYPYGKDGIDYDMVSYALVKSFPAGDARWDHIPAWVPKEAFYRLGAVYTRMADK